MKSRIFVIEDHALMRRSMVDSIERESDLAVCGQAEDTMEAFGAIVACKPDLVITDIQLKASDGLNLIMALRWHAPPIPVIAISILDGPQTELRARAAGAAAFVSKHDGPGKMIETIHAVLKEGNATK